MLKFKNKIFFHGGLTVGEKAKILKKAESLKSVDEVIRYADLYLGLDLREVNSLKELTV